MGITYLIGYTNLLDGKITYEEEMTDTPDAALYNLQYTIARVLLDTYKVNIPNNALDEINFVSKDIPGIIINKTLSLECVKNELEDLQILCHHKISRKGYLYNTSKLQTCFNFFLKQIPVSASAVPTDENTVVITPEIKTLIDAFKQIRLNARSDSFHRQKGFKYPVHKKIKKK